MFEDLVILQIKSQIFGDLESLKTKPQKMSHFVSLSKMGKGSPLAAQGAFWLSPLPPILYNFFSHSLHIFPLIFCGFVCHSLKI